MFQGLASSAGTPEDRSPLFIFTAKRRRTFKTWHKESPTIILDCCGSSSGSDPQRSMWFQEN
jgi:hypothetical protein